MNDTHRYLFIWVAALVAFCSFAYIGPFNMSIDGDIYISQILQFDHGELLHTPRDVALRAFKPFPGVWGSMLTPLFSPEVALQLLNLLFLFGLPFAGFYFLKEIGFDKRQSAWGALWIITGYPVLKYGLSISTDIGGWFFALLSAYLFLKGVRTSSYRTLILASCLGFIGGTIKEPGVFGLIFAGAYTIITFFDRPTRQSIKILCAIALPALILEIILISTLFNAGLPTFLDWYGLVATNETFKEENYRIFNLIGVLASAFSVLLIYAFLGFVDFLKRGIEGNKHILSCLIALFVASLPILLWKIFISRVLYIQFLFFIPMALFGVAFLSRILRKRGHEKWEIVLYLLPIISSVALFFIAGKQSLFTVFF